MDAPTDPVEGPDTTQDTFDFSQGMSGLPSAVEQQLRDLAESLGEMGSERRRHLTIAMSAVGATWLAPMLGARRLRKRRRRRRRSA